MGDSIKQARAFMQCCEIALTTLSEATSHDAVDALTAIQSGAKLNHARAIYRAAQSSLEVVNHADRLRARVASLTHLIKQYETGLVEMEAHEFVTEEAAEDTVVQSEITEDKITDDIADIITVDFSEAARQERATAALSDAITLATSQEKLALETLLALSKGEETKNTELVKDQKAESPTNTKIPLDSFISDVVQQGLTFARQSGITLSLSYDMGTVALPEIKAKQLQTRMERWVGCLVRHLAATSPKDAMVHIDMSATPAAVSLSTTAPALSDTLLSSARDTATTTQMHDEDSNSLTLHLSLTDTAPLLKAPKMPVDEGIGARLDALLSEDTNLLMFEPKQAAS